MHPIKLSEIMARTSGKTINPAAWNNGLFVKGISTDTRTLQAGQLFVAIGGANFDGHNFLTTAERSGAAALLVTHLPPNLKPKIPVIQVTDTVQALGNLARYYRTQIKAKVIAVTGSNGKTTTKEMIYHILSKDAKALRSPKSFNNFIGVPLTMFLVSPAHQYAVLELGTNQKGEISYLARIVQPDVAVITNIGPTHLAGLDSLGGIAREKASLLDYLKPDGRAVVAANNRWLASYLKKLSRRVITFGTDKKARVRGSKLKISRRWLEFLVNERYHCFLPVLGSWNMSNALAAIAAVSALGVEISKAVSALRDFTLPSMRMEREVCGGVTLINDAYNANPASVGCLLEDITLMKTPRPPGRHGRTGRKILVLGEMKELGKYSEQYHREIADKIARSPLDIIFIIGSGTRVMISRLRERKFPGKVFYFSGAAEVGVFLEDYLKPGSLVVFKGSRTVGLEEPFQRAKIALLNRSH